MRKAVFIERDGILNQVRHGPRQQITPVTMEEFVVIKERQQHIQALKDAGFLLIATTNQPGLSRGYQSRRELDMMHNLLRRTFPLDDIMVCPHDEGDHCPCRKPKPGLLIEAAFKWHINLDHSFVISDKWQDSEAARTAGCTSLLLKSPYNGNAHHDFILGDFDSLIEKLLQLRPQFVYA